MIIKRPTKERKIEEERKSRRNGVVWTSKFFLLPKRINQDYIVWGRIYIRTTYDAIGRPDKVSFFNLTDATAMKIKDGS